jgi:hypothetical protein
VTENVGVALQKHPCLGTFLDKTRFAVRSALKLTYHEDYWSDSSHQWHKWRDFRASWKSSELELTSSIIGCTGPKNRETWGSKVWQKTQKLGKNRPSPICMKFRSNVRIWRVNWYHIAFEASRSPKIGVFIPKRSFSPPFQLQRLLITTKRCKSPIYHPILMKFNTETE